MARLLLVRHGESTWNAAGRWQGQADPPLSPLGERQAGAARPAVVALGPDAIVASDLARARRTAELLAPDGLTPALEPALREREAGEWTGLTRVEIEERHPGALAAHRSPSGFEGDDALLARVLPALDRLAATLAADATAVVVTHGGVVRTLERHLGERTPPLANLGGRWVHLDGDERVLGPRELLVDPDDVTVTVPGQI